MSFKVVTYNIRHGKGIDNQQKFSRIIDLVLDVGPDILGVNELDYYNPRSKWENQPKMLADAMGYNYVFHATLKLGWAQYGNGLFSRWPISDYKFHNLPSNKEPRGCLEALINHPQGMIRVMVLHLGLGKEEQEKQLTQVALLMGRTEIPTLLMGDFNRSVSSEVGVLGLLDTGDESLGVYGNTFPANDPTSRIDYILCSEHFQVIKTWVVETSASDHLPVVALVRKGMNFK
ncbi:MAG: endonuclease/exonuclease/phosphatase family protein [Thermincolia bacterium]